MARYKLNADHFLGDRYYAAGSVIDWHGPPSREMEGVDDAGRQAIEAGRPSPRRSPDLLPSLRFDPMRRLAGQPRAAGPPGQEPPQFPSNPDNPVRTVEIARAVYEQQDRDAKVQDEIRAAAPAPGPESGAPQPRRRGRPATGRTKAARARRQATTAAKTTSPDATNPEAQ